VEIPKNYSIEIDTPFDLRIAEAELDAHLFLWGVKTWRPILCSVGVLGCIFVCVM